MMLTRLRVDAKSKVLYQAEGENKPTGDVQNGAGISRTMRISLI